MVKTIKSLIHQKNSITGASVILVVTLFLSNILGVIRDHYLTQKIPTELLSAYYAAFRIPDLIFNILILGAIVSAFIPVFTSLINKDDDKKEAWLVASSILNIAIILLIAICLLLFFILPSIIHLIVPGFDSVRQELTLKLARIMLVSPILFGLSYIFGGILNSFKRFFVYSLAPLVYNLVIILGTLFFADRFSVVGVAYAVVIGAFLHFLIQLPVAIRLGFRWTFKIYWSHWGVKRIGLLMIPRALALGGNQIMLLIFTAIASSLGGYAVAVYNLADNIQTMPMVVFGTSFATAIFPTLSEAVSLKQFDVYSKKIEQMMRAILFFLIPFTVIFILLRTEIVRLILGSGYFGWEQTIATANTLGVLIISLTFTGLTPLFARAFYALHNTKTPMIISLLGILLSIILAKILTAQLGILGLALAYTSGGILTALIFYLFLRKKVNFNEKELSIFIFKICIASILAAVAIQESKMVIGLFVDMHTVIGVGIKTFGALLVGGTVYLISCWIFGCEEIGSIKYILTRGRKIENSEGK